MSISLTPRLQQAITQAATSHDGHYRKGSTKPYVTHVVSVMLIASEYTDDEDILIACLLHDIMEDRNPMRASRTRAMKRSGGWALSAWRTKRGSPLR